MNTTPRRHNPLSMGITKWAKAGRPRGSYRHCLEILVPTAHIRGWYLSGVGSHSPASLAQSASVEATPDDSTIDFVAVIMWMYSVIARTYVHIAEFNERIKERLRIHTSRWKTWEEADLMIMLFWVFFSIWAWIIGTIKFDNRILNVCWYVDHSVFKVCHWKKTSYSEYWDWCMRKCCIKER